MRLKTVCVIGTVLSLSFFGGTFLGKLVGSKQKGEEINYKEPLEQIGAFAEIVPSSSPPPAEKVKPSYLIALSDKELCVYEIGEGGAAKKLLVVPAEISQLRSEDYEKLCKGIKVSDLEEAMALLEDFGS